jgi:hypothetical protein
MEDRFDRLEAILAHLRNQMAAGFAAADQRLDETRAHLIMQIDSVRDDVRIFAEAHVALEQRTTGLERRPR